jgi:hypothetical protein
LERKVYIWRANSLSSYEHQQLSWDAVIACSRPKFFLDWQKNRSHSWATELSREMADAPKINKHHSPEEQITSLEGWIHYSSHLEKSMSIRLELISDKNKDVSIPESNESHACGVTQQWKSKDRNGFKKNETI